MAKFAECTIEVREKRLTLREAVSDDAPAMLDFLAVIATETPFTYQYPSQSLKPEALSARFSQESGSPFQLRLLALERTRIVGQIGLWRRHPDHPWLQHKAEFAMMLVREWWGSGLARELLAAMESFARASGVKRIEATVSCGNQRGVGLYSKNGYAIEGTARAYKIVDGKPLDSYYIAKLL